MKIKIVVFIILIFITGTVFANPFDMILYDDPVIEDIRFLSLETGRTFLSFSPPFALGELENFLKSIDPSTLSPAANDAYIRIEERLTPKAALSYSEEIFSVYFDLTVSLEAELRLNSDIKWKNDYPIPPPLISAPIRFNFSKYAQIYADPQIYADLRYHGEEIFETNLPIINGHLEEYVPLRAYGALGGSWWNFMIGRENYFWGSGNTGSLIFNANSQFYDFARLTVFSENFKYTILVNHSPIWINESLMHNYFGTDPNWNDSDGDYLKNSMNRHFYMHRLDFRLFKRLSISLMEGVMIGNAPLDILYLNPITVFHSLSAWLNYDPWGPVEKRYPDKGGSMVGSFLGIEINWNITKSFSFYGQLVMNEFALPGELEKSEPEPPNALGYMAGLQYSHSFNEHWAGVFYIDAIYTDPYLFNLGSPYSSMFYMRYPNSSIDYFGYPRDTFALTLGAKLNNNNRLFLTGSLAWIAKGQKDSQGNKGIWWDWDQTAEARLESTPTGIVNHKIVLSLSARWKLFPYLTIGGNLTGIVSLNNNHSLGEDRTGAQLSLYVSYHLK